MRIALNGVITLLISGFVPFACHRTPPLERNSDRAPVLKDTSRVVRVLEDTSSLSIDSRARRRFKLRNPGQHDSLRATLRRERSLWRAMSTRDYEYLLRVECFCPGRRGWLSIEVRDGRPLRARDAAGKSVPLTNGDTYSIDVMFDNLERMVEFDGEVQIAFDPRWHFPTFISTVRHPGPDNWSIVEARGLRPI